jgi:hypothetical protein
VIAVGNALVDAWPKSDSDGQRDIRCDGKKLVMRLVAITARQPLFSLDVLDAAAREYISKPAWKYHAPQYFFSLEPEKHSGKPPFYELAAAIVARRRIQALSSQQSSGSAVSAAATVVVPLITQEAM